MATTITQRWRFGPGAFAAVAKHARHVERVSDEHLMRRVQAGDRQAFGELYDRHCGQAFGFALKICDTRERAEEAVQDAFLCLWRTRARYDPTQGRVQTWLLALVRNRSIDMYRRHVRHNRVRASEIHLDLEAAADCVEEDAVASDDARRVRAALRQLSVAQREVIVLAYFGGLTHTEIAIRLGLPLGTVKGRMRAALGAARREIERAA